MVVVIDLNRLLKKAHLLCCHHSSSLRRTSMYDSFLGISGALYLNLFEQPVKKEVSCSLLMSGRGWDIKKRETVFNPAKGGTGILF